MRMLSWWFCMFAMTLRRILHRPVFLLFLILFPAGMGLLHQVEETDSGTIAVALYPGQDAWNQELAGRLEAEEGAFSFYSCGTEEEAEKDVMTGRAECAYLFPEGLHERIREGRDRRAVQVLISPSTAAEKIISEKVFSELFEVYGREVLVDYGRNGAAFQGKKRKNASEDGEKAAASLAERYERYRQNGSTFSFSYRMLDSGRTLAGRGMKADFPVRGVMAVFIFIMGLAAAVMAGEDAQRGLYAAVRIRERCLLQTAQIAACTCMAEFSAFAAWMISGTGMNPGQEAGKLLLYLGAVTLYSSGLLLIFRKPVMLASLIPVFIVASVLLCPIFFDMSAFFPELAKLRYLLPPWWYLSGFFI